MECFLGYSFNDGKILHISRYTPKQLFEYQI